MRAVGRPAPPLGQRRRGRWPGPARPSKAAALRPAAALPLIYLGSSTVLAPPLVRSLGPISRCPPQPGPGSPPPAAAAAAAAPQASRGPAGSSSPRLRVALQLLLWSKTLVAFVWCPDRNSPSSAQPFVRSSYPPHQRAGELFPPFSFLAKGEFRPGKGGALGSVSGRSKAPPAADGGKANY